MRKWTFFDIKEIALLESEIFTEPWTEDELKSSFSSNNFYTQLIEQDGKIVAYIGASITPWDSDICLIAVRKEYRGKGYAKQLLTVPEMTLAKIPIYGRLPCAVICDTTPRLLIVPVTVLNNAVPVVTVIT